MMIAYDEVYVSDAKKILGQAFDYLINDFGVEPNRAADLFITSGYAQMFEIGNPSVVAGMSGIELGMVIIDKIYVNPNLPEPLYRYDRTPEYWVGWALAEFQWASGRTFKDIFRRVSFEEMLKMYPIYHEMDVNHFVKDMEERCSQPLEHSRLYQLRVNRGYSQAQLAKASGVNVRSIQLYEQRVNDIDKAQVHTVYRLARAIGCSVEDLLEQPLNHSK